MLQGTDGTVLFEAELSGRLQEVGVVDEILKNVAGSTRAIAETVAVCSHGLVELFADPKFNANGTLKSVEIEFGVKVSSEGNVYVVKASTGANIAVKLVWDFTQLRSARTATP